MNDKTEDYILRPASVEDVNKLARLYRVGSAGLMDAVYANSEAGLSTTQVLEKRIADPHSVFGYTSFEVATVQSRIVGQICTFPEEALDTERLYRHLSADRRAILETINSINYPGSLYISTIMVSRSHRGTNIVRNLLQHAESKARRLDLESVSIHAFGDNSAAISLYCRMGYKIYDSKQLPPDPALVYSGPILLLAKEID